jgi:ankyrin repeat protein
VPVDTDSALLNLPGVHESPIPVDGDHSTMVKFNSPTDRTYQTVLKYIRQLLKSFVPQVAHDSQGLSGAARSQGLVPKITVGSQAVKELIDAIQSGDVESVRMLLEVGASANGRDLKGVTMLHHAARIGDEEIVQMLVANGAQVAVRDFKGKSPVDYARSCGHTALAIKLQTGRL